MTTVWRDSSLGEVLTFQRGFDITKKEQVAGQYPVISSSGPSSTHHEAKVRGPGVLIGRKGSLGRVHFSESDYWPHDTTLWVKDFKLNDPKFVYYLLQTLGLEKYDVGSSNPTLNRNHLHLLSVRTPDTPTQIRIARALYAYDELIENNTKRIKILEEMAQSIYKEWFANFRYPGHENVPLVDSELGPIPEGWRVEQLGDIATLTMGQSPKSEFYNRDGVGLPFHQGVTNFGSHIPLHLTYSTEGARRAGTGDVLLSVRAPVGRINVADTEVVLGRGVAAVSAVSVEQSFLLFQLKWIFRNEDSMGSGSIFHSVTKRDIQTLGVLIPPEPLRDRFTESAGDCWSLLTNLTIANRHLRQTRDLLLPRLVSGEITV